MKPIPEQKLLKSIKSFVKAHERLPRANECHTTEELYSAKSYQRAFGSWNEAIIAAGFEPTYQRFEEEELLQIIKDYYEETNEVPLYMTFREDTSLPSSETYIKRFGSFSEALKLAGLDTNVKIYDRSGLLKEYYDDKKNKLSSKTLEGSIPVIGDLRNFLFSKDKDLKDLDSNLVAEYFEIMKNQGSFSRYAKMVKPNSPNTLNAKARIIQGFLTWLDNYDKRMKRPPTIEEAVVLDIRETLKLPNVVPPLTETERRSLSEEELSQVRTFIRNPIKRNIFDLGLNLGLRVSEYEKITLEMVLGNENERRPLLSGGSIPRYEKEHYIEVLGKGNKLRKVVVTEAMKLLIKKQLHLRKLNRVKHNYLFFSVGKRNKGRLQPYKANALYKRLAEESGVRFRAHELRYTMAVLLQDLGVPKYMIEQRLGHSGDVTTRYSRAKISQRYKTLEQKVGMI